MGKDDVATFLAGTFGDQVYNGPIVATPYRYSQLRDLFGANLNIEPVVKDGGRTGRARWTYLFETARLAWSKLRLDPTKIGRIKRDVAHTVEIQQQHQSIGSPTVGASWEISSVTSSEAGDIEDGLCEEITRKMKSIIPEVEEPDEPTLSPDGTTETAKSTNLTTPETITNISKRIRENLDRIRQTASEISDFTEYLRQEIYGTNEDMSREESDAHLNILQELSEALEVELDIKKDLLSANPSEKAELLIEDKNARREVDNIIMNVGSHVHWRLQLELRKKKAQGDPVIEKTEHDTKCGSSALASGQHEALDQYMEITGHSEEGSAKFLAYHRWDVHAAVSAFFNNEELAPHLQSVDVDEDEDYIMALIASSEEAVESIDSTMDSKASQSEETMPQLPQRANSSARVFAKRLDDDKSKYQAKRTGLPKPLDSLPKPHQSGLRKEVLVEDAEEDLVAARARLESLIAEENARLDRKANRKAKAESLAENNSEINNTSIRGYLEGLLSKIETACEDVDPDTKSGVGYKAVRSRITRIHDEVYRQFKSWGVSTLTRSQRIWIDLIIDQEMATTREKFWTVHTLKARIESVFSAPRTTSPTKLRPLAPKDPLTRIKELSSLDDAVQGGSGREDDKLASPAEILEGIEVSSTVTRKKRPSLQTALDVINGKATNKKARTTSSDRNSSERGRSPAPTHDGLVAPRVEGGIGQPFPPRRERRSRRLAGRMAMAVGVGTENDLVEKADEVMETEEMENAPDPDDVLACFRAEWKRDLEAKVEQEGERRDSAHDDEMADGG